MVFSRQCCLLPISWVDEQLHCCGCLPVQLSLSLLTTHRSIQAQIYKQWFCHLVIIADREIKYWFSSRGKKNCCAEITYSPSFLPLPSCFCCHILPQEFVANFDFNGFCCLWRWSPLFSEWSTECYSNPCTVQKYTHKGEDVLYTVSGAYMTVLQIIMSRN